jgi:hypothetical protein
LQDIIALLVLQVTMVTLLQLPPLLQMPRLALNALQVIIVQLAQVPLYPVLLERLEMLPPVLQPLAQVHAPQEDIAALERLVRHLHRYALQDIIVPLAQGRHLQAQHAQVPHMAQAVHTAQ